MLWDSTGEKQDLALFKSSPRLELFRILLNSQVLDRLDCPVTIFLNRAYCYCLLTKIRITFLFTEVKAN